MLRRRQRQQSEIAEQCAGGEISKKTHTERNIHLQRTAVEREEILQRRRETMTAPQLETRIAEVETKTAGVETRTGEVETVRDTNIANWSQYIFICRYTCSSSNDQISHTYAYHK